MRKRARWIFMLGRCCPRAPAGGHSTPVGAGACTFHPTEQMPPGHVPGNLAAAAATMAVQHTPTQTSVPLVR